VAVEPGSSEEQDRARWSNPWSLVALVIVGFIVIESAQGIVRDTDPNKWGWGSALVVGLAGAFSFLRNLLGFARSGNREPSPGKWWHQALAFALLFAAVATKALTAGESVLAAAGYASVYFAILLVVGLGMYSYKRGLD
jgi:hypothetical protein